ncbi:MAG: DNA gyrase inhibitor YacG [Nitrospinae bacterium]|nr:DNA gyrase inhibitor YacG [Nitrospinota bacterium]MBI3814789.1 DNA gyrase inhibitor YacG [Nitrospinota bacterium]
MKKAKCPLCKTEFEWDNSEFRPFCSERCKLIDLWHWAGEKYFIPGKKIDTYGVSVEEIMKNKN